MRLEGHIKDQGPPVVTWHPRSGKKLGPSDRRVLPLCVCIKYFDGVEKYCMAGCSTVPFNASSLAPTLLLHGEGMFKVNSLEGGSRSCARSAAGIASDEDGGCVDLGVANSGGRWRQLRYFPALFSWMPRRAPTREAQNAADSLQRELTRLQLQGGCAQRPVYTVPSYGTAENPSLGTCAVIEHAMLALARSASSGSRLVLGRRSAPVWTSQWLCDRERSLSCYFNMSGGCCPEEASFERAAAAESGIADGSFGDGQGKRSLKSKSPRGGKALRRGRGSSLESLQYGWSRALTLGGALSSYNTYGSLWVSGQLIHWLFTRMHPHIRKELDRRRAAVSPRPDALPVVAQAAKLASKEGSKARALPYRELCIGMHVRRGDSCSLGSRFCPDNKTATYFAAAASLRQRYSINRLVVATDDAEAAALCHSGVLGFDCRTRHMDRERFNARESIERRVAHQANGLLSGSAVTLDALADLEMIADCEAHVLVLRSAVSRLALALSVARKGRYSPLISLQWPWGGLQGPLPAAS